MDTYYLAIDIGASSGRHILGRLHNGIIETEEIHRFKNELVTRDGALCWDLDRLFSEVLTGIRKCKTLGKIPRSVGIDTWGVDYVLLDGNDHVIGQSFSYRDGRTQGMDEAVYRLIPENELYARTGIQKIVINTIYQLMSVKQSTPEQLNRAQSLLLIPDYFNFLLTGRKRTEYTNATTTQLLNPETKTWDFELIDRLGYPRKIFTEILPPGSVVGGFTDQIAADVGFNCQVILPGTHDTASAVLAVPAAGDKTIYISSGTWSLMGVERPVADCSPASEKLNFTNEGGYEYRFRYLKNIMGLWMIQCLQRELDGKYSFAELCDLAENEQITSIVDCNSPEFLAPDSMISAVQDYCQRTRQEVPETPGELARVIYASLADCFAKTAREIELLLDTSYDTLNIVGGGAQADYLNQLTANSTGMNVVAGPAEATSIGNLMVQMLANHEWGNLAGARECVRRSFELKRFTPHN